MSVEIPGCHALDLFHHRDHRGEFVKVFQASAARAAGDDPRIEELFWSRSARGVVRGLHFQVPPAAHSKIVTIMSGRAFDVVVDLRVGSPTFRQAASFDLDADHPVAVIIPVGCAHGFQALTDDTVVAYATSTEHAPESDQGVRWDSIEVAWPLAPVGVSARDAEFPPLSDYRSPFTFPAPTIPEDS